MFAAIVYLSQSEPIEWQMLASDTGRCRKIRGGKISYSVQVEIRNLN